MGGGLLGQDKISPLVVVLWIEGLIETFTPLYYVHVPQAPDPSLCVYFPNERQLGGLVQFTVSSPLVTDVCGPTTN